VGDPLTNASASREIIDHLSTPRTTADIQTFSDQKIRREMSQCLALTVALASESLYRWEDQDRLAHVYREQSTILKERMSVRDEELNLAQDKLVQMNNNWVSRYSQLEEVTATVQASQTAEIERLKAALLEATQRPALTERVSELEAEVQSLQSTLLLRGEEAVKEKAVLTERVHHLEKENEEQGRTLEQVRTENHWWAQRGLKEFSTTLHQSSEFMLPHSRRIDAARASGYTEGVREGYTAARQRTPLSRVRNYDPQAPEKFAELMSEDLPEDFPYFNELAALAGQSVDILRGVRPSSPPLD
jgi:hypothetical protein